VFIIALLELMCNRFVNFNAPRAVVVVLAQYAGMVARRWHFCFCNFLRHEQHVFRTVTGRVTHYCMRWELDLVVCYVHVFIIALLEAVVYCCYTLLHL
jgi:hypothetical protein